MEKYLLIVELRRIYISDRYLVLLQNYFQQYLKLFFQKYLHINFRVLYLERIRHNLINKIENYLEFYQLFCFTVEEYRSHIFYVEYDQYNQE